MMLNFKFSLPFLAGLLTANVTHGMNSGHGDNTQRTSPRAPLSQTEMIQKMRSDMRQNGITATQGGILWSPKWQQTNAALGRDRQQGFTGGDVKAWMSSQIISNGLGLRGNAFQTHEILSPRLDTRDMLIQQGLGVKNFSSNPFSIVVINQDTGSRTYNSGFSTSGPTATQSSSAIGNSLQRALPNRSPEHIQDRFSSFGGGSLGLPSSLPPSVSPQQSPASSSSNSLAAPASNTRPVFNSYSEEVAWKARQAGQVGQRK
ncbi:MAG: hypothetical protein ACRC4G_00310 [Alphaproteobacteria bacterium]